MSVYNNLMNATSQVATFTRNSIAGAAGFNATIFGAATGVSIVMKGWNMAQRMGQYSLITKGLAAAGVAVLPAVSSVVLQAVQSVGMESLLLAGAVATAGYCAYKGVKTVEWVADKFNCDSRAIATGVAIGLTYLGASYMFPGSVPVPLSIVSYPSVSAFIPPVIVPHVDSWLGATLVSGAAAGAEAVLFPKNPIRAVENAAPPQRRSWLPLKTGFSALGYRLSLVLEKDAGNNVRTNGE